MKFIETIAPIAIEDMKQYFANKEIKFLVDYSNSTIKGEKFLTYLSNLDLPCDVEFKFEEDFDELFEVYLNTKTIVKIPSLEESVIELLLQKKKLRPEWDSNKIEKFQNELDLWQHKLESMSLYNLYSVGQGAFEDYIKEFKTNDTDDLTGVNFINLFRHTDFFSFYEKMETNLEFYTKYFNDYMFKGKNMFSYWAVEENPMFMLTWGIAEGVATPTEQTNQE